MWGFGKERLNNSFFACFVCLLLGVVVGSNRDEKQMRRAVSHDASSHPPPHLAAVARVRLVERSTLQVATVLVRVQPLHGAHGSSGLHVFFCVYMFFCVLCALENAKFTRSTSQPLQRRQKGVELKSPPPAGDATGATAAALVAAPAQPPAPTKHTGLLRAAFFVAFLVDQ